MGLDITLGVLVLLSAVRGWFKGFLRQAIPLGALVGCVYLADPVRDLAHPYAQGYFPSIGHEVLDRLLWWTAAVLSYVLTSGIALTILKSMRRRTYGDPEPNRTDQGAGFTLGAVKGLIVAAFLASAVTRYAPVYLNKTPMVEDQTKTSKAMIWSEAYRPADRIWTSRPVQSFIGRIKSRGMWIDGGIKTPSEDEPEANPPTQTAKPAAPTDPLRTASARPKTLSLPSLDPDSPSFARELEAEIAREGLGHD